MRGPDSTGAGHDPYHAYTPHAALVHAIFIRPLFWLISVAWYVEDAALTYLVAD